MNHASVFFSQAGEAHIPSLISCVIHLPETFGLSLSSRHDIEKTPGTLVDWTFEEHQQSGYKTVTKGRIAILRVLMMTSTAASDVISLVALNASLGA